jgi:hypothetical protein
MNRHDNEALFAALLLASLTFVVIWLVEHFR